MMERSKLSSALLLMVGGLNHVAMADDLPVLCHTSPNCKDSVFQDPSVEFCASFASTRSWMPNARDPSKAECIDFETGECYEDVACSSNPLSDFEVTEANCARSPLPSGNGSARSWKSSVTGTCTAFATGTCFRDDGCETKEAFVNDVTELACRNLGASWLQSGKEAHTDCMPFGLCYEGPDCTGSSIHFVTAAECEDWGFASSSGSWGANDYTGVGDAPRSCPDFQKTLGVCYESSDCTGESALVEGLEVTESLCEEFGYKSWQANVAPAPPCVVFSTESGSSTSEFPVTLTLETKTDLVVSDLSLSIKADSESP